LVEKRKLNLTEKNFIDILSNLNAKSVEVYKEINQWGLSRLKNKNKGYVEYGNKKNPKDYSIGIEDVTWDSSNVDSFSFSDAEGAIKKTLGQFNWYVDENDDLIVVDRYNFNDAEELQKKYPTNSDKLKHLTQLAGSVVTGETSAFGWLRRLGGLYGSVEGEGAEFKINLGKLEL